VAFNDVVVADGGQILRLIQDAPIGGTARVVVIREGERTALDIPIEGPT
jgi:hypothetical protein